MNQMKKVFLSLLFCLSLPELSFAGEEQKWSDFLETLAKHGVGDGSQNLSNVLQTLSQLGSLDSKDMASLLALYDRVAQIAEPHPEKKEILLSLIFSHFDFWLAKNPSATPSPLELKDLMAYARRLDNLEADPTPEALDEFFRRSITNAFLRSLRVSVKAAGDVPYILDADLPRSVGGTRFRRELCGLAVDRFVSLSPRLNDIQRMIGHLGMSEGAFANRQEFLLELRKVSLKRMTDSENREQRRLARFIRSVDWKQEGEILLLVLLSSISFKREEDLRAVFDEVAELFASPERNLGLPHGRAILFHYLYFLKRTGRGDYSNSTAQVIFDFPNSLLKKWYLAVTSSLFENESYVIDPSPQWGSRYQLAKALEKAVFLRLMGATAPKQLFNVRGGLLRFSAFPSLDMEEAKWNVMVDYLPHFIAMKPQFRDLINYLAVLPRASPVILSKIWLSEKESQDSDTLRFARSLLALRSPRNIITTGMKDAKPFEGPGYREAILKMGSLILLEKLKTEEVFSGDLIGLLRAALGADFDKLKKTKTGFIYKERWSSMPIRGVLALARACGFVEKANPFPPANGVLTIGDLKISAAR